MELIACPDCDLLQELPELPPGAKARCPRRACTVATRMAEPIDLPLALTVTAAIAFIIANTAPLMSLSAVGRYASTTIGGGAKETPWFIRTKLFSGGGFYLCRAMPGASPFMATPTSTSPDGWESVKDFNFDKPSRSSISWIEKVGIGKSFSEQAKRFACRLRTKTQAL